VICFENELGNVSMQNRIAVVEEIDATGDDEKCKSWVHNKSLADFKSISCYN